MNEDILEEFATRVAEARARGRKPENFAHSLRPNFTNVNSITSLDEWIDFLNLSPDTKDAVAEGENAKEDQGVFSMSKGGMKRALNEIDRVTEHADKKMRVMQIQMEDMNIDEKDHPQQEGLRRFYKNWDRELHIKKAIADSAKKTNDVPSKDESSSEDGDGAEGKKQDIPVIVLD
ncbi:hypothetical protein F5X99DRAFT_413296 [Biscogniauxia marginata]|nr:hypothetical protein F5X99DRAFT_413296 [Biscogniauxia marginata]